MADRRRLVPVAVLAGLTAAAAYYVSTHAADFSFILDMSPAGFGGIVAVTAAYLFSQCVLLRHSLLPFSVDLRPFEWIGLMISTLFANYFLPAAGLGVRAVYLNRRHGLGLEDFALATGVVLVVELLVYALAGFGVLLVAGEPGAGRNAALAGLAGVALAMIGLMTVPARLVPASGRLFGRVRGLVAGWRRVVRHPGVLVALLGWTIFQYLCFAAMFALAFATLNIPAGPAPGMAVAAITDFGFLIRFAPGAAGSFEAAVIFSAGLFQIGVPQALAATALVRAATMILLLAAGPPFAHRLAGVRGAASQPD